MNGTLAAIDRTRTNLGARLLERRTAGGYWEGFLASSALSTATAIIALKLHADRASATLIDTGVAWLVEHANQDGGWGDTVLSGSNLSTTALCWGALAGADGTAARAATARAEAWLRTRVGELTPQRVREAVVASYGEDRTFSVPILTALTLAGRLGGGTHAWRAIPQLPFELAACPHRCLEWLRLPVVSYALPALVAIGQVRHHQAPTRNPVTRGLRAALKRRTLTSLRRMQPATGGYLEATPLTAFVVMSLVGAGRRDNRVVADGVRFLAASARADGSWPIDTNLATWVTTLAVNALGDRSPLPEHERGRMAEWLLAQQNDREHPFTHAAPGGWAWTDLPGGVPDADDTAGALIALAHLARRSPRAVSAAERGACWLADLQNRDGGIPTFCRGWGALPFDRSAPDLTAHALEAWSLWHHALSPRLRDRIAIAARRAVDYLARSQRADGSWLPLWFGNQHAPDGANPTYGTARVVGALSHDLVRDWVETRTCVRRGSDWLLAAQSAGGGWGGAPGAACSIEETGVALRALARVARVSAVSGGAVEPVENDALLRGARWLVDATDEGRHTPPSPIGLYFARLWYFEEMYPIVFALGGLNAAREVFDGEPTEPLEPREPWEPLCINSCSA